MPTTFRPYAPDQELLLPTSLREWLPEDHLAYFISDAVDALDLSAFYARYEGDGRRRAPFEPVMMVKVLVYGYATGVFSSRKMAQKLKEDVAFRVLGANNFPAHRTIREFRQVHLQELSELFVKVVKLAQEAGLVKLGRLGVDGTKVRANASKRKAMSYGRMRQEQARLKQEIQELLTRAEKQDRAEDREHGDRQGDELPEQLRRRSDRLKVIEAAKARLEARQRESDEAAGRHEDDDGNTRGPTGRRCQRSLGEPPEKAQENFTDPESRIMKTSDGYQQCYNAQAAVDETHQLIVASDVSNSASDAGQLIPLVDQTRRNTGRKPTRVLADTGYACEAAFEALEQCGIAGYVALGREGKNGRWVDPDRLPATARMAKRLASAAGKAHYRRRKAIPEPVFGWIKHVLGFRRFSLRGLAAAKAEWNLVCLAVNLKQLHAVGWKPARA
jgi:transposase